MRGERRDCARAKYAERSESLEVGLDACAPARIRTRDGECNFDHYGSAARLFAPMIILYTRWIVRDAFPLLASDA